MLRKDVGLWVFGVIAAACLVVSAPATYRLVALYHSDGTALGIISSVSLLIVLEIGAVAAKLATLWVTTGRRWLLGFVVGALGVNTLSNFLHGVALAGASGLSPWVTWPGALLYAAAIPALLYLMLHLFCERVRALRGTPQPEVAERAALIIAPVVQAVEVATQVQRSLGQLGEQLLLSAPQASYPRAQAERSEPVLVPQIACPQCGGAARRMQLVTAPQHGGWRCTCGHKVPLAPIGQ